MVSNQQTRQLQRVKQLRMSYYPVCYPNRNVFAMPVWTAFWAAMLNWD